MIKNDIKEEILNRLKQAEQQHDVRVLFAVESGSRAWGFASTNSDYDARFVYAKRDIDWYLAVDLEDKRDVIEYPIVDEIDINGWDIRKSLKLFWKSNPTIVEWLLSPIVYRDDGFFSAQLRELLSEIYSPEKGIYHYRSMAATNYRGYLRDAKVPLKKYFYVLRPLLAVMWLEKYRTPAPIEFDKLRQIIDDNESLNDEITDLVNRKKRSKEKELVDRIEPLNAFIEDQLLRLENFKSQTKRKASDMDALNTLFRATLRQ